MTDLSRFDGHTEGPWSLGVSVSDSEVNAEITVNCKCDVMTMTDIDLAEHAPALLARVKELEAFLSVLNRGVPPNIQAVDNLLNKEWLK